jgi:predicted nucleic acid-binding protein
LGGQARRDQGLRLIDSSVWIEYLRNSADPATEVLEAMLLDDWATVATCAPVAMELRLTLDVLARRKIERTLAGLPQLDLEPVADFELAADIYRAVRHSGHTVRSILDCLIAAIAHRTGAELVHRDVDIERIAAVLPGLRSRSLRELAGG